MATRTLGTAATTTLTAVPFPNLATSLTAQVQDIAAINALIKDDVPLLWALGNAGASNGQNATQIAAFQNTIPNALSTEGRLYVPNRGFLKVYPGDWIGVDTFGWPVLISGRSLQSSTASWQHSGNPT